MIVEWSPNARTAFLTYLRLLVAENPVAASRADREVREAADNLADFPLARRASRWVGLRELVLPRWKKLIVYRVEPDRVVIVAFFDARQDFGAVEPEEV